MTMWRSIDVLLVAENPVTVNPVTLLNSVLADIDEMKTIIHWNASIVIDDSK